MSRLAWVTFTIFATLMGLVFLMPVASVKADSPLNIYPLNITSAVCDGDENATFTCTPSNSGGRVQGSIGSTFNNYGGGFWFDRNNLAENLRAYTDSTVNDGIIGYQITVLTYTVAPSSRFTHVGEAGPAVITAGGEPLPGFGHNLSVTYPRTYCLYWGSGNETDINVNGACDETIKIDNAVATQDYDMIAVNMDGHTTLHNWDWQAEFSWVVRGEPEDCDEAVEWHFNSSMEEWSAIHYSWSASQGHDNPGSLWYLASANASTQLSTLELQSKLGTSSAILSNDVTMSFRYRGQVDGSSSNTIQLAVYYTDGSTDNVQVTAINPWNQATLTADNGKYIGGFRFFSITNGGLQHWIDDVVLTIPCINYSHDGTPTPTAPPPTSTPAPTATPIPPTPAPNPGGDPIPSPGTGPVSGCYLCERPARFSISFFGQWITYLACVIWNIFSCSVRIWFMNVVNSVLGVWQTLRGLVMWLPAGLQYIMDWTAGLAGDFVNYLLSFWDKFRAAFTNIPRRLVEMIIQSEPVQAVWRFATWLEGLWQAVKTIFQAVLSVIRNVYEGVVGFIHMLIGLANAVRQVWSTPPYELDFIPGEGGAGESFLQTELQESGANNTKIYWLIVTAMAAFDTVLAGFGLNYIQFIAIGILSLILIAWTLNHWRDILPI